MIDVAIDTGPVLAALTAGLDTTMATLQSVAQVFEAELVAAAMAKADNDVLHVISGAYLGSIQGRVDVSPTYVGASVFSDAPGAGLLEYGGMIPAHDILPVAGEALRFLGQGVGDVYAAVVHVPDIEVAPHPVIHAAFDEMEDAIADGLTGAVRDAWL